MPDFRPLNCLGSSDLCAPCGMCCNGVMFHTVELQPDDSPRTLASLGLKLKQKAGKFSIQQPCPAFKDSHCSIYSDRPERCRIFECRQLTGVKAGTIPVEDALKRIAIATELVSQGNRLFELLGEPNPGKPRMKRYNNIMADAPEPGVDPDGDRLRAELVAVMEELEELLENSFRIKRLDLKDLNLP